MEDNLENTKIIKESFYNFLGGLIDNSPYDERGSKQSAIALILEEIMSICKEDGKIDFYSLKPVLRLSKNLISVYGENTPINLEKVECKNAVELIDTILNKIK